MTVWQDKYKAATLEVNRVELRKKIDAATAAIHERIGQLAGQNDKSALEEKQAINDALQALLRLRRLEPSPSQDEISQRQAAPRERAS